MFKYEDDGICMAEDSDALQEITDISQVQGDWWVLKGQNCGQDETWRGEYSSKIYRVIGNEREFIYGHVGPFLVIFLPTVSYLSQN